MIDADVCRRSDAQSTLPACGGHRTHPEKTTTVVSPPSPVQSSCPSSFSIETGSPATLDDKRQQLSTLRLFMAHFGYVTLTVVPYLTNTSCLVQRWRCSWLQLMPLVPRCLVDILKLTFLFQTIISTSLPTIASDLHASQAQYTWVGVAYMLTQTAFQPLYGKISDLVGRKVSKPPRTTTFIRRVCRLFYTPA